LLAVLTVWSAVEDARKGRSALRLVTDVGTSAAFAVLFAAYFVPALGDRLGRVALPLFVGAFAWTGISVHREIGAMEPDPQLSPRANLIAEHLAIFLGVLAASPAIAFGALAAIRHW
jgi:hypothetical protein